MVPKWSSGMTIATSFSGLVTQHLADNGVDASVVHLDGAVETAIQLGVAEVIADVVETGTTLRNAGLEIIGEPILESEAVVVSGWEKEGAARAPTAHNNPIARQHTRQARRADATEGIMQKTSRKMAAWRVFVEQKTAFKPAGSVSGQVSAGLPQRPPIGLPRKSAESAFLRVPSSTSVCSR